SDLRSAGGTRPQGARNAGRPAVGRSRRVAARTTAPRRAAASCERGYAAGCSNLGVAYEHGWGVRRDVTRAVALYRQACDAGEALGCGNLARVKQLDSTKRPYAHAHLETAARPARRRRRDR